MTAIAVVSSTGHVIDLPDAGHYGSWVPLLKGLTACGDQRLDGHTYSRSLDRSLIERDRALLIDGSHTGHAARFIDWVWGQQLPDLVRKDSYRQQVEDRCSELQAKSERLSGEINSMVGGLLSEQSDADIEREQLQALLGE